ncbi:flagellar type III secretion system pore protein FliP [Quadrisphaera sp. DSM 44207]|uniref:flagellar type III secretion system pore protein FliP n=1 Tax=Quadrisphaera sp. DSM 44207 TaxID=1881057 RepID=UPI00088F94EF|nr:flagellar type III secretion system pore protein FliP [Quadrisphaera sp. DSM 44207]SDQ19781.1 flagellar biosynthetic protein FliP [Quadrisphaera sp. DSM 44207]
MTPSASPPRRRPGAAAAAAPALAALVLALGALLAGAPAAPAAAAALPAAALPAAMLTTGTAPGPTAPVPPAAPDASAPAVSVDVNGVDGTPSSAVTLIIAVTLLAVAPALLLMTTAFTKIIVVLSITRNALGLTSMPPNQVLAGLALFLTLFVMAPVISEVNEGAVQPYLAGAMTSGQAFEVGVQPVREFMLGQTRGEDLALISRAADRPNPASREDVPLLTLVPAFVLSELRAAFIIGFVIFVPFLVIDVVVSAALMAMGMMMLPPVTVALPFKLLLFVLVNGWGLIITALVGSYGS